MDINERFLRLRNKKNLATSRAGLGGQAKNTLLFVKKYYIRLIYIRT